MEERTRLFHLVQLVKTLDLENLGYDDGDTNYDYDVDGGDRDKTEVDSSSSRDGFGNLDEDISNDENVGRGAMSSTTRTPCVRRLDFSDEATHHQRKLFSCSGGTVHVYGGLNTNNEPLLENVSHLDNESAGSFGCQNYNIYTPDVHSHSSNLQKGEIVKQDVTGRISMNNSDTRFPSQCVPCHKQKHSSPVVASNTFKSKALGHRKRVSRKHNLYTEKDSGEAFEPIVTPTPVYEAERLAGYNYGLPLSSPPAANKR